MSIRLAQKFAVLLLVLAVSACGSRMSQPTVGQYRATLHLPGGEVPFGMEIAQANQSFVLYLVNGSERTQVSNVTIEDGQLRAAFPGYENSLRADIYADRLAGSVTLIKAGGVEQVIPFEARLGQTHRFFEDAVTDNADIAGRWSVAFTDDDGTESKAVALFEQQHDRITGTVMTPTGDHRFLEGQIRNNEVWLSTFAGGLPYLYKLRVDAGGTLQGEYWQGLKSHEKLTASRNEDAVLVDPESLTTMKDDIDRFDFTFRDLDGQPVSLSDQRFRNKVVVVTLGGSWCPNCHDEAMFLAPFYAAHREQGFEVIALMFERHGDFTKAAAAARRFKEDLGVQYTTLIAGISDKDEASKALPGLSGVYGYPTAIFIDRQGKVRKIHTGFTGPATGRHYEELVDEFSHFVDELLAESVDT